MPCFSLPAQMQMRAMPHLLRVNAKVSCQAGGMACGLRPTLAGDQIGAQPLPHKPRCR